MSPYKTYSVFPIFIRKSIVTAMATVITVGFGVLGIDHVTKHTDAFRGKASVKCRIPVRMSNRRVFVMSKT